MVVGNTIFRRGVSEQSDQSSSKNNDCNYLCLVQQGCTMNNEHDCLDYVYVSLDGLVSSRLTGSRCGLNNAATSRILANAALVPIL